MSHFRTISPRSPLAFSSRRYRVTSEITTRMTMIAIANHHARERVSQLTPRTIAPNTRKYRQQTNARPIVRFINMTRRLCLDHTRVCSHSQRDVAASALGLDTRRHHGDRQGRASPTGPTVAQFVPRLFSPDILSAPSQL